MMINRRMFLAGTASAAMLATLAACSGSSESGATAAKAINKVERGSLKQGGTLRFGMGTPVANWNNSTVDGNGVDLKNIYNFVAPGFFDYDDKGEAKPNPNFVTKVEDVTKDGKTTVTMVLNPKAKWNSGRQISPDDFIATIKCTQDKNYLWASTDGYDQIEKVEKVDDTTVKFYFKSAFPDWTSVISGTLPKEQVATAEVFNNGMAKTYNNDWYAGPFKIESYNEAQQVVTLVPNEKWWGDKPLLDKVTFRVLDSAAEATSFANKEIDVLDYIISANTYKQAQQRTDAEVRQNFGLQWRHFTLNASSGVLADKAVRQALMRATDRAAITKSSLAGMPVDANKVLLGNHFFMPSQEGYVDNSTKWSHDGEAAKKLLDGAGWKEPSPGAIRVKDGKKLSIKYTRPTAVPTTKTESELLQSQLKKIGMEVVMEDVESAKYFKDYINKKNFEITSFTWQGTPYPMMNIGQIYGKGNSNFTGQSIKELNELIDKIAVEADHKKRVAMTNQADEIIWENVLNFPIYERMQLTAVPKKLANFGAVGLASYRAEDIGFTA